MTQIEQTPAVPLLTRFRFEPNESGEAPIIAACAAALQRFTEQEHLPVRVCVEPSSHGDHGADGVFSVETPAGTHAYIVEVKRRVTAETVDSIINQLKSCAARTGLAPMLVAPYINDRVAESLRRNSVAYLDAAGNLFFPAMPLMWIVSGRKPQERPERATRAFQATGLQLIALLLAYPESIQRGYRKIAEAAGVSLGSVSHTLRDLRTHGFLRRTSDESEVLDQVPQLFAKWVTGYSEHLRPRLALGSYRAANRSLDDVVGLTAEKFSGRILIGGEFAAAAMTGHLRPERVTLHLSERDAAVTTEVLRLIPDAHGNIALLRKFGAEGTWDWRPPEQPALVHPLLVHAELLCGRPDDRLWETAQRLCDQYLSHLQQYAPSHQR